jgi:urease accessory protein
LPVAVAVAAAGHDVDLPSVLEAYAVAFVGNLVSAAIRLSVIGQTDGQRIIADLMPALRTAATAALATTLDDVGGATFAADLAAVHHETQYTRLFRS